MRKDMMAANAFAIKAKDFSDRILSVEVWDLEGDVDIRSEDPVCWGLEVNGDAMVYPLNDEGTLWAIDRLEGPVDPKVGLYGSEPVEAGEAPTFNEALIVALRITLERETDSGDY